MYLQRWLVNIDAFVCLLLGTVLFFAPAPIADFIFNRKTDGIHWHLLRCIGGQYLGGAFILRRIGHGSSELASSPHILRILGAILTLLLLYHCQSMTPDLIPIKYVQVAKVWCFGTAFMHFSIQSISGWQLGCSFNTATPYVNFLYQLDSLVSIAIGSAWMAFPKWLLYRQVNVELDESHEFLGRLMGANFITCYLISTHAMHWKDNRLRMIIVDTRAIICISILIAQVWSQYAYDKDWGNGHWVGISLFSSWAIVCFLYRLYLTFNCKQTRESAKNK